MPRRFLRLEKNQISQLDIYLSSLANQNKIIYIDFENKSKPKKRPKRINQNLKVELNQNDLKEIKQKIKNLNSNHRPKYYKNYFALTKLEREKEEYLNKFYKIDQLKDFINQNNKKVWIFPKNWFFSVFSKSIINKDDDIIYKIKHKDFVIISTKQKLGLV